LQTLFVIHLTRLAFNKANRATFVNQLILLLVQIQSVENDMLIGASVLINVTNGLSTVIKLRGFYLLSGYAIANPSQQFSI